MKAILAKMELGVSCPLFGHSVRAGFPNPADDYQEISLDLNEHVIRHPSATYFVRAEGDSMTSLGIFSGDLLVVDRANDASDQSVVIVALNGELTCKIYDEKGKRLLSANNLYPPIHVNEDMDAICEGVVTFVLKDLRCLR